MQKGRDDWKAGGNWGYTFKRNNEDFIINFFHTREILIDCVDVKLEY